MCNIIFCNVNSECLLARTLFIVIKDNYEGTYNLLFDRFYYYNSNVSIIKSRLFKAFPFHFDDTVIKRISDNLWYKKVISK